jgi:CDP-4-dehydro-6-deoxyglucose reductase
MKERTILRFEGPLGTFFLREDSGQADAVRRGRHRLRAGQGPDRARVPPRRRSPDGPVLGRALAQDLYLADLPMQWQREHRNFSFVPVLSEPLPADAWQGRTGFVHQAVLDDFDSLAGFQVYACGAPAMTDIARQTFVEQKGLPEDEFYCDAFTPSVDPKR